MNNATFVVAAMGLVTAMSGCAAEQSSDAGAASDDSVATDALVTSVNADGTWTGSATKPMKNITTNTLRASASFTGPTGKTRKMGVCLLELTETTCSTVADCASSPVSLPTGGSRYCTGYDGSTGKYCAYRPGSQTEECAGSPANGAVPVPPGTYTTPASYGDNNTMYISYGCFEGCLATDPSTSSPALLFQAPVYYCNGVKQPYPCNQ